MRTNTKAAHCDYASAVSDWCNFCASVDMKCLDAAFEKEQHEYYYMLNSRWTELPPEAVFCCEPKCIQEFNDMTCTRSTMPGALRPKIHSPPFVLV
ncbi:hypothetical protein ACA910_013634 [Epithemia clementina (nom. ined.)]